MQERLSVKTAGENVEETCSKLQKSIFTKDASRAPVCRILVLSYCVSECKVSLEKGGFFMKDDGFYCQEDYQRYFVAKCKICSKDLIGEIVTVMNFSFHRECFKCTGCS